MDDVKLFTKKEKELDTLLQKEYTAELYEWNLA